MRRRLKREGVVSAFAPERMVHEELGNARSDRPCVLHEQEMINVLYQVQFPYADFVSSLVRMGISANVAGLYAEMARAFNDGKIKAREGRTPENTTPTRFEDFAEDLAHAYEAS